MNPVRWIMQKFAKRRIRKLDAQLEALKRLTPEDTHVRRTDNGQILRRATMKDLVGSAPDLVILRDEQKAEDLAKMLARENAVYKVGPTTIVDYKSGKEVPATIVMRVK